MPTTNEYLDKVIKKHGITSDNKLAQFLGISRASVSHYRNNDRVADDFAALKIAEALGIDRLKVIAEVNAERENDPKKKAIWQHVAKSVAASLIFVFAGFFGNVDSAYAAYSTLLDKAVCILC